MSNDSSDTLHLLERLRAGDRQVLTDLDDLLAETTSLIAASQVESILTHSNGGAVSLLAADNVILPLGSTVRAHFGVVIQGDYQKSLGNSQSGSIISISGRIFAGTAKIDGGDYNNDVISLTNVTSGTVTTGNTGGGVNTVNVGIIGPLMPDQGVLGNIQAPLSIVGAGSDTLNLDDSGDGKAWTGNNRPTLTATNLTGLGMGGPTPGVGYSGLEALYLYLGTQAQTVDVLSSAAGTTSTFVTQAAGNTWNVGSLAPDTTGGVLAGIKGPLVLDGGGSGTLLKDTLNVDDSGSTGKETGTLTDSTLTGLRMGTGGITFYEWPF